MSDSNNSPGQIINNIISLQNYEQKLYLNLEKLPANSNSKETIVRQINKLSQTRTILYEQLQEIDSSLENTITTERSDLEEKINLIKIYERQLNKSKKQLNKLKRLNNNHLRLTEINTYYSKQYVAYNKILRLVLFMCLPLLILAIIKKNRLLPSIIINGIGILVLTIGLIFLISNILDLYKRDNMVFDEYEFAFNNTVDDTENNKSLDLLNNDYLKDIDLLEKGECLGPKCCSEGMIYKNNECVME